MGGMGGMGGGFFDVEDELTLGSGQAPTLRPHDCVPAADTDSKPREIRIGRSRPVRARREAWDAYFGRPMEEINEADVRETLRRRMSAHQFSDVVTILQSALRQGYVRPWMYEALSLAMQAMKAPADEIERAIMSAVDLSGDPEEIMLAAVYLSRSGHEARALKLFREVADANPLRPEPYIQGLELANRLERHRGACVGR